MENIIKSPIRLPLSENCRQRIKPRSPQISPSPQVAPPIYSEQMGGADGLYHRGALNSTSVIHGILKLKGRLKKEDLREIIESRFLYSDRMMQVAIKDPKGNLFWSDVQEFDTLQHIREIHLGENQSEASFIQMVERLLLEPLSPNRPLWEICMFHMGSTKTYLVFRIHHSIGDGMSLIATLFGTTDNGLEEVKKKLAAVKAAPESWQGLNPRALGIADLVEMAGQSYGAASQWLEGLFRLLFRRNDSISPLKRPEYVQAHNIALLHQSLSLGTIKSICRAHDVKVNDVILTVLSLALRNYCKKVEGTSEAELRKMTTNAFVPISTKPFELFLHISILQTFLKLVMGNSDQSNEGVVYEIKE